MNDRFEYESKVSSIPTLFVDTSDDTRWNELQSGSDAMLSAIDTFVRQSFLFVPTLSDQQSETRAMSRVANQQLLHQLDLALRKKVGDIISGLSRDSDPTKKRAVSLELNLHKKHIYDKVKSGEMQIPGLMSNEEFIDMVLEQFVVRTTRLL